MCYPASTYVADQIYRRHTATVLNKMRDIIRLRQNSGTLFEFVASKFCLAGASHTALPLPPSSSLAAAAPAMPPSGPRMPHVGQNQVFPPGWRSPDWTPAVGTLYYQLVVNIKSIDAFTVTADRDLVLFQLTVADEHGVQASGLLDVFSLLSSRGSVDTCSLVFVVPLGSSLCSVQALLTAKSVKFSRDSDVPAPVRHLLKQQYIISLDMDKFNPAAQSSS